jgi:acetolactate synthase regulatory subunit
MDEKDSLQKIEWRISLVANRHPTLLERALIHYHHRRFRWKAVVEVDDIVVHHAEATQ